MDCKAFRKEFEELETGEALSLTAQGHVDSCPACRSFQSERLSLRQLVKSLGAVSAPPDFDFRLRARLAEAKSNGNNSLRRARFAPGLKAISVAASFALLIASAVVFKQFQPASPNAPASVGNPAIAESNTTQTPKSDDNSAKANDGQLAAASQSAEATETESKHDASQPNAIPQSKNRVEKIAQAKLARSAVQPKTEHQSVVSNDITFGGNPPVITPVRPTGTSGAGDRETAALLRVSSEPLKVLLHDRQGAMRSVSLERVVFGSQDFMERSASKRKPASENEGIW